MRTLIKQAQALMGRLGGFVMVLTMMAVGRAHAGDVHLDVLRFGTETLTNVTVTGKSKTDIYVSHARGLVNVKIRDLDSTTLFKLGLGAKPENAQQEKPTTPGVLNVAAKVPASANELLAVTGVGETIQRFQRPSFKIPAAILAGVAVGCLAVFLFFSYCLKLIVEKTGNRPGPLVWVPILQLFPMLQAAGMSGWWVLGFCLPVINVVASILWAINIVKVRQKSIWVTIALVLPVTNLIGFIYLAFSSAGNNEHDQSRKPVVVPKAVSPPTAPQQA